MRRQGSNLKYEGISPQQTMKWNNVYDPKELVQVEQFHSTKEAHVWLTSTETSLQSLFYYYNLLSAEEKKKTQYFKYTRDRNHFVASHGILRQILAAYMGCAPCELSYGYTKFGKPFLLKQKDEKKINFNMTHTSDTVCIVVSGKDEVGIDLEQVRSSLDWYNIAKQYFSRNELLYLESLSDIEQTNAFFLMWTRKEAMLKASGVGLSGLEELEDFSVTSSTDKHTLISFISEGNLQCSIAVSPWISELKYFRYITNLN